MIIVIEFNVDEKERRGTRIWSEWYDREKKEM